MIKRVILYLVLSLGIFFVIYLLHNFLLKNEITSYSLIDVYLFHLLASILVYLVIEQVAEYVPAQAGYAYLAAMFLKLGFFLLLFKSTLFSEVELLKIDRISLVIPLFLFLTIEAAAVFRLLNSK